jgi:hypothetical protein
VNFCDTIDEIEEERKSEISEDNSSVMINTRTNKTYPIKSGSSMEKGTIHKPGKSIERKP